MLVSLKFNVTSDCGFGSTWNSERSGFVNTDEEAIKWAKEEIRGYCERNKDFVVSNIKLFQSNIDKEDRFISNISL